MKDSTKCFHDDEFPQVSNPGATDDNQIQPSRPSTWRSNIRAATSSYAFPLSPSNTATTAPRRRRHYIVPQEDSGTYIPSGPLDKTSGRPTSYYRPTSHYRPEAPSNPFEDPQYEIGATVPERRPMREWQDILEDQRSDSFASAATWKHVKAYRERLRSRVRAVFKSTKKTNCKHQQQVASTLLNREGTQLGHDTMRGLQCIDCQREMEAKSLVR